MPFLDAPARPGLIPCSFSLVRDEQGKISIKVRVPEKQARDERKAEAKKGGK